MITEYHSVCVVIVSYFPDEDFERRVNVLAPQAGEVVIVDNTPGADPRSSLRHIFSDNPKLHLIQNDANLGVAKALNQGLKYAEERGYKWILTLDQDTQCYSDMVSSLLCVFETCKPKPSVIGSNYLDSHNNRFAFPHGKIGEFLEQKTVITSGSLVDVKVAREIGGFREDFFIDQVDHEFCLRSRKNGYRVVVSRKPVMIHSVGNTGGAYLPFIGRLPNHPAVRKYYVARNTIVIVANYWRREPMWCLRRVARLIVGGLLILLIEPQGKRKLLAFMVGIKDGFVMRMGPHQMKR